MAAYLYSDIFVLLSNLKQPIVRSWLETPPQTFMQTRWAQRIGYGNLRTFTRMLIFEA